MDRKCRPCSKLNFIFIPRFNRVNFLKLLTQLTVTFLILVFVLFFVLF